MQRWDRRRAIDYLAATRRSEVEGLPPLPDAALDRAMHLILPSGAVFSGARSLPHLLPLLPGGFLPALALRLPGALWLADRAYQWVAARRHRFGCGPSTC